MATIQIRDVPEDTYEAIHRRARGAGRSIQSYMRDHVIEFAATPTKAEIVGALERSLREFGGARVDPARIAEDVAADRR